jgi:hypothetical protein
LPLVLNIHFAKIRQIAGKKAHARLIFQTESQNRIVKRRLGHFFEKNAQKSCCFHSRKSVLHFILIFWYNNIHNKVCSKKSEIRLIRLQRLNFFDGLSLPFDF